MLILVTTTGTKITLTFIPDHFRHLDIRFQNIMCIQHMASQVFTSREEVITYGTDRLHSSLAITRSNTERYWAEHQRSSDKCMRKNYKSYIKTPNISPSPERYGPFTRYVKYGLRMRRERRERFSRHRGLANPTGITARASRTCRDACRDRWLAVFFEVGNGENVPDIRGACRARNFTYLARGPWGIYNKYFGYNWPQRVSSSTAVTKVLISANYICTYINAYNLFSGIYLLP